MKILPHIFNEGKQLGIVYHFTPLQYLPHILETGYLTYYNEGGGVSTTRNHAFDAKKIIHHNFIKGDSVARIMLDGDKITNKYSTRPMNYDHAFQYIDGRDERGAKNSEAEEFIRTKFKSLPVLEYIIQIDIFVENNKISHPESLSKAIELMKELGIPYRITDEKNLPVHPRYVKEVKVEPISVNPDDVFDSWRSQIEKATSTNEMLDIMAQGDQNLYNYHKRIINKRFKGNLEKSRQYFIQDINTSEHNYWSSQGGDYEF